METYVLDTNLFFNMEAGLDMGQKTEEVIKNITAAAKRLKEHKEAQFFVSPRIVEEILSFFEVKDQLFLQDFLSQMVVKTPDINKLEVAAPVVYQLVEDIRARSYRGLTVAEEEIKNGAKNLQGKSELSKKDFEITIGATIKHFRDRYRQATRFGFLDSLADLDIIMLAKETDGFLISTDEGVIKWGRVFGVKEMPVNVFGKKMKDYLS